MVPGSKRRSQPGVRCRGQWVPESRHSLGSSDLNTGFACLLGKGEIPPGMKILFRGWEREDYGLPSALMFNIVNNNKKVNDPQVPEQRGFCPAAEAPRLCLAASWAKQIFLLSHCQVGQKGFLRLQGTQESPGAGAFPCPPADSTHRAALPSTNKCSGLHKHI